MESRRALIVTAQPDLGRTMTMWLSSVGHDALLLTDFNRGRSEIEAHLPYLLIAEVKLAAFNGLHLVSCLRRRTAATPAIIVGNPDVVLEREAQRLGALYMRNPLDRDALIQQAIALIAANQNACDRPSLPATALAADASGVVETEVPAARDEDGDTFGTSTIRRAATVLQFLRDRSGLHDN
jgi:DNA-binding response OmpR family regulator